MKKNKKIILIILTSCFIIMVVGILAYFWQGSSQTLPNQTLQHSTDNIKPISSNQQSTINPVVMTNHPDPNQHLSENTRKFLNKIEFVLANVGTRSSKLSSFMSLLKEAQTEDEIITTLQALESLKPIEYADDLILFLNNPNLSAKVKSTAINTLGQSILLSDDDVEKIGASTVYVQSEKVRNYINGIVENPNSPKELYNPAVQNYYYTSENATPFAKKLLNNNQPLNEAETTFLSSAVFADNQSTQEILPELLKNSNHLNDEFVSQIGTFGTSDVVLQRLSLQDKQHLIQLLQSHPFNQQDEKYYVFRETADYHIQQLQNSMVSK